MHFATLVLAGFFNADWRTEDFFLGLLLLDLAMGPNPSSPLRAKCLPLDRALCDLKTVN